MLRSQARSGKIASATPRNLRVALNVDTKFSAPNSVPSMEYAYQNLMHLGSYICHQDPTRSFSINGQQFILCARCTGIYSIVIIGLIFAPFCKKVDFQLFWAIGLLALAVLLNLLGYKLGFDSNIERLFQGSLLGLILSLLFVTSLQKIIGEQK